jgi:hypothetical protein
MKDKANIIQVHLGDEIPAHLYAQLRQTRVFNPDVPVYLIVSRRARLDADSIDELGVVVAFAESIRKCRNHRVFSLFNRTNRRSMGGFWLHASERFFAIESFMSACRMENVVHMENDVMLYAELASLIRPLRDTCPRIGITMDSESRCVPGFVFIRDLDALRGMNSFLLGGYLRKRQNDMEALAAFMAGASSGACSALPVVPSGYRALHPLENALGRKATSRWYDESFEAFGGVFDAAALGQYLGGIDRRINKDARPGFVNETAVYDPRDFGLEWKVEAGLRRPYGRVGGVEFPIFNLHIHSKDLEAFSSARRDGS